MTPDKLNKTFYNANTELRTSTQLKVFYEKEQILICTGGKQAGHYNSSLQTDTDDVR